MKIDLYSQIRNTMLNIAVSAGCINRLEPEDRLYPIMDQVITATGVDEEDLRRLEEWLLTLDTEQWKTLADGEQQEIQALVEASPQLSDGRYTAQLFEDFYEAL